MSTCKYCDQPARRVLCGSDACARTHKNNQQRGKRYGIKRSYECAKCGKRCSSNRPTAKYCGSTCVNLARYDRIGRATRAPHSKVTPRDCEWCGSLFMASRVNRKRCAGCKHAKPTMVRVYLTDCSICSKLFATPYTVPTCSTECAATKRRRLKRASKDKRRALQRDAFVSPVHRHQVFERDGWRCHLCSKPINRDVQVPHPKAATIDHVIPLAAGGTHEPLNCRTAHFLCNALKRDQGHGEQLLLIA